MPKRLGESDRRAVDLLLDHSTAGVNGDGGYVMHVQPASEPGIQSVQRVLALLDLVPAEEPPLDLVSRTMARIEAGERATTSPQPAAAALMTSRPHA